MSRDSTADANRLSQFGPYGTLLRCSDEKEVMKHLITDVPTEGRRVLDVGFGTGEVTAYIASQADSVVGIEPYEPLFEFGVERMQDSGMDNVDLRNSSWEEFDASDPEPFDVIFCNNVLFHLSDPVDALGQMAEYTDQRIVVICDSPLRSADETPAGTVSFSKLFEQFPDRVSYTMDKFGDIREEVAKNCSTTIESEWRRCEAVVDEQADLYEIFNLVAGQEMDEPLRAELNEFYRQHTNDGTLRIAYGVRAYDLIQPSSPY